MHILAYLCKSIMAVVNYSFTREQLHILIIAIIRIIANCIGLRTYILIAWPRGYKKNVRAKLSLASNFECS